MKANLRTAGTLAVGVCIGLFLFVAVHLWNDHNEFHMDHQRLAAILGAMMGRGVEVPQLPTPATIPQATTTSSTTTTTVKK